MSASVWVQFGSPLSLRVEAESVSMGATTRPIAGTPPRKAQPADVSITRYTDDQSSKIMLHAARGAMIDTVTVKFYNNNNILYVTYTLKTVFITSFSTSGHGDYVPMEHFGLSAESMTAEYF